MGAFFLGVILTLKNQSICWWSLKAKPNLWKLDVSLHQLKLNVIMYQVLQ